MSGVFIVAAKRTPFGKFGGAFKKKTITDLTEKESTQPDTPLSGTTTNQNSLFRSRDYLSANQGPVFHPPPSLRCGVPKERPAYMINRLCGSGFQSVVNAAQEIKLGSMWFSDGFIRNSGESSIVAAGGSENMTQMPYLIRDARFGIPFGTMPPVIVASFIISGTDRIRKYWSPIG
eukprot:sb/3471932/